MKLLDSLSTGLAPAIPMGLAVAGIVAVLFIVHHFYERRNMGQVRQGLGRQIAMLVLTVVGLLIVIIVSPLSDAQKGQLLSLVGILLSAAIALSSTTFLGNAMAGVMLRAVRSFRTGDFIRVGDQFGRVSERGLFHTEIQTEDRDLVTLPNLHLVTNPVKVIRTSGTLLSAEVSLGYDVPRTDIERLLIEAATASELEEPFVHVTALGDFSVNYRVSGLLKDVKQVISARSHLRKRMLDALHEGGVEIVSPNFMNTRAYPEAARFIPAARRAAVEPQPAATAEALAFDKAEEAESAEMLQVRRDETAAKVAALEEEQKAAGTDEERARVESRIEGLRAAIERLDARIAAERERLDD